MVEILGRQVRSGVVAGWNGLLELLYPSWCEGCGVRGEPPLCDACIAEFRKLSGALCPRCPTPVGPGGCPACSAADSAWNGWAFDRAQALFGYAGVLRHAVHVFKYRGALPVGPILGSVLAQALVEDNGIRGVDVVVPVPGEPSRSRKRGCNPSRVIAQPVAEMLGVPLVPERCAVRTRRSLPQMGRTAQQRRCDPDRFGFRVPLSAEIAGKSVLIVDDVFTTGSTVQALSRELRDAGAAQVQVVALCSGQ